MAFVFMVEDGTGVTGANSYATVSYADDYLVIRPGTNWTDLTVQEKQFALVRATQLLDQRVQWAGEKYGDGPLRWPRQGVVDRDGIAIPYDEIPEQLKQAVVEYAYFLIVTEQDPSLPDAGSAGGAIKRIKADVLEIEYVEGTSGQRTPYPLGLGALLRGLGYFQSAGGMGFKRILRA